jgi:hypothetical protein
VSEPPIVEQGDYASSGGHSGTGTAADIPPIEEVVKKGSIT